MHRIGDTQLEDFAAAKQLAFDTVIEIMCKL